MGSLAFTPFDWDFSLSPSMELTSLASILATSRRQVCNSNPSNLLYYLHILFPATAPSIFLAELSTYPSLSNQVCYSIDPLSPATDGSGLGYFRLIRSTKNLPICLLPGILLTASNLCHTIHTILAHSLPSSSVDFVLTASPSPRSE